MNRPELGNRIVGHYKDLLGYCIKLCEAIPDAEDLCQTTICKALQSRYDDSRGHNLKAYLFKIATNTHINQLRYRSSYCIMYVEDIHDLRTVVNQQSCDEQLIRRSISRLSEKEQKVASMIELGFKYEEMAAELNIGMGRVKSLVFYTRKKLLKIHGQDLN